MRNRPDFMKKSLERHNSTSIFRERFALWPGCLCYSASGIFVHRLVIRQISTPKPRKWMCSLLLSLVLAAPAYAQNLRVRPLVRGGEVLVTFALDDVFTEAMRQQIQSGLKTTFTYTVELRQDVPAWVDRTIATSIVTISVQYDNLTRRATLVLTVDAHVDSTETTEDDAVIRQWMTRFQKMPLFRTAELEQNREYYVRVGATARPTNGSMLWPWGSGISGITKFTFLR